MEKTKSKKKVIKIIGLVFGIMIVCCIINLIPTWNLRTSNMNILQGHWVNVYYEKEEAAAVDVFQYADAETEAIAQKLGFNEKQDVNIYIYDNQYTMQQKKYGLIGPLLGLGWYIGDNIGTNVILTSPANPGPDHDYDNNKYAVPHEIVHAYISVKNPNIHLWLTEGAALYLTNGVPFYKGYLENSEIPSYNDTQTRNPIQFEACYGYTFAQTYIEYIDKTYGWNSVLQLIETEDYEKCFKKSQQDIYNEWVEYIKNYYQ